ncbi:MAG: hypothetical protein KGP28_10325 [Bdellovibrionales bacterium]|nr:hypothetical protein [Bdellovibrionales bacterium]
MNRFRELFEEARVEVYDYFDRSIRRLPRDKEGLIKIVGVGLDDNDVDAFRHAYVSGVFTQEYGEKTAEILGLLNEYDPIGQSSNSADPRSRNMDLWNNRVGRKYGGKTSGRKGLLKLIHQALKAGELITDLKDPRKFSGKTTPPKRMAKPIIALQKSKSGRVEMYFDLLKRVSMTREELVSSIQSGAYSGYSIKIIRGVETPVSKHDGKTGNNIG